MEPSRATAPGDRWHAFGDQPIDRCEADTHESGQLGTRDVSLRGSRGRISGPRLKGRVRAHTAIDPEGIVAANELEARLDQTVSSRNSLARRRLRVGNAKSPIR
jgi:hypothetical protein